MQKGTNLQTLIDAVKIKIPTEDLTGKEDQIVQLLRGATARCKRKTYDNIDFYYDPELMDGYFYHNLSPMTIELLSLYVVRDYMTWRFNVLSARKKYIGTNAFNKIASYKEDYDFLIEQIEYWNTEIEKFEMDFPDYSEAR